MTNVRKIIIGTLLFGILSISILGCTAQRKPGPNQPTPNQGQTEMLPNQLPSTGGQSLSAPSADGTISNIQRAQKITQQLNSIGNISRAPVLIDGGTAIVGIEFIDKANKVIMDKLMNYGNNMITKNMIPQPNPSINNSRQTGSPGTTTQINISQNTNNQLISNGMDVGTAVTQIVRNLDRGITRVLVTTDRNIIDRIQRLSTGITDEINDIANKIQRNNNQR